MKKTEEICKLRAHALFKRANTISFVTNKKVFEVTNLSEAVMSLVKCLVNGVDSKFIENHIKGNNELESFYNWLTAKGWLIYGQINPYLNTLNEKNYEYIKAIRNDANIAMSMLNNANVSIVGCGGIGAIVAQSLVAMGFNELSLIDCDVVEYSNLNRQTIYSNDDVGKYKAEVLSKKLKLLNPNLKTTAYVKKIQTTQDIATLYNEKIPDFMVCGIDTPPVLAKIIVAEFCLATRTPCIFGSVGIASGSYGPLLDRTEKILSFTKYLNSIKNDYILEEINVIKGSLCATNSTIASFMSLDILKWFSKLGPLSFNKIVRVDFDCGAIKSVLSF